MILLISIYMWRSVRVCQELPMHDFCPNTLLTFDSDDTYGYVMRCSSVWSSPTIYLTPQHTTHNWLCFKVLLSDAVLECVEGLQHVSQLLTHYAQPTLVESIDMWYHASVWDGTPMYISHPNLLFTTDSGSKYSYVMWFLTVEVSL